MRRSFSSLSLIPYQSNFQVQKSEHDGTFKNSVSVHFAMSDKTQRDVDLQLPAFSSHGPFGSEESTYLLFIHWSRKSLVLGVLHHVSGSTLVLGNTHYHLSSDSSTSAHGATLNQTDMEP